VVRDFRNIECRDAVLAYDRMEYVLDERGVPVTRWDGETMRVSPITGEKIPDDTARKPVERYINPRKAAWPDADFVVGNPPFIGNKRMRIRLGDGYVEALRSAWPDVPDTSDLVMYWWQHAALLTRLEKLERFGLISTNSIRQAFNRKVIENAFLPSNDPPRGDRVGFNLGGSIPKTKGVVSLNLQPRQMGLSLAFAIPDHPWVDSDDGAAVRISMTVGEASRAGRVGLMRVGDPLSGPVLGRLLSVVREEEIDQDEVSVELEERYGIIHADLTIGARVISTKRLMANEGVCFQGMNLVGKGFRLSSEEVMALGFDLSALPDVIKPHFNARDFMQGGDSCFVIDFFGLSQDDAAKQFPSLYQRLLDRVKPER
nr:class I SAM-dependent DNA methyltransferase [Xanthomonadaceae bacterium]